jgi:hypothetical protein
MQKCNKPLITVTESVPLLSAAVAAHISEASRESIAAKGSFSVCFSGAHTQRKTARVCSPGQSTPGVYVCVGPAYSIQHARYVVSTSRAGANSNPRPSQQRMWPQAAHFRRLRASNWPPRNLGSISRNGTCSWRTSGTSRALTKSRACDCWTSSSSPKHRSRPRHANWQRMHCHAVTRCVCGSKCTRSAMKFRWKKPPRLTLRVYAPST